MFMNIEELEVPPILTTKNDDIIWNIFPDFGNKKEEATEEVENIEEWSWSWWNVENYYWELTACVKIKSEYLLYFKAFCHS